MSSSERVIEYKPLRARKAQSVHDFFAARGKNGPYRQSLRSAYRSTRRERADVRLRVLGVHLLRLLLGDRLMNAVLSDRAVVVTREYVAGKRLYHFAPDAVVDRIVRSGLLPKDRYVYLMDAPQQFAQDYLPWKTERLGKTTAYTLLEIDAGSLRNVQKIFCTDREHEYVTGRIDARYISVVPDDRWEKQEADRAETEG